MTCEPTPPVSQTTTRVTPVRSPLSFDAGLDVGRDDGPGLGDRLDPAELGVDVTRAMRSDAGGAEVRSRTLVGTRGRHGELGGGAVDLVVPERIGPGAVEVPLDRDDGPGARRDGGVTVSVTGWPTFTSARAPPLAVADATGWMPPRSAAVDGSRTWPSA